jgi:hypothetical protein
MLRGSYMDRVSLLNDAFFVGKGADMVLKRTVCSWVLSGQVQAHGRVPC